jgi:hypothetical protein
LLRVSENPFRTLGVCVSATPRQIEKAISDLEIFAQIGKPKEFWYDKLSGTSIERSNDRIAIAANSLEKPSTKLQNALFWFWENTSDPVDEMAFDQLKEGNIKKAAAFWEKGISSSSIEKTPSYWKNLSTLYLFLAENYGDKKHLYVLKGLKYMGPFLASSSLNTYADTVTGGGNSYDLNHLVEEYSEYFADELSNQVDMDDIKNFRSAIKAITLFPQNAKSVFIEKYAKKIVRRVEAQLAEYEAKVNNNESDASTFGLQVHDAVSDDAAFLVELIEMGDLHYLTIIDNVFSTLLQASITAWNENDVDEKSEIYKSLLKLESIIKHSPASQSLLDRAEEQFGVMHEVLDREKKMRPLLPLGQMLGIAQDHSEKASNGEQYTIGKDFVFSIKYELDKAKKLYAETKDGDLRELVENLITNCSVFVNQCGVTTANKSQEFGRAIELVDMARRILLYESGFKKYTVNEELSNDLMVGRRTLTNNSSNSKGLLGFALGGGIRAIKKNTKCGCGSGKNLNDCCSI